MTSPSPGDEGVRHTTGAVAPLGAARFLVVGLGVTGRAMVVALRVRGFDVVAVEDRADAATAGARSEELGIEVHGGPDDRRLAALVSSVDVVLPSPGVPDRHPVFALAAAAGVGVASEFDLAAAWDDRPRLAVTGTNGKTTVCEMTAAMLVASGIRVATVGNTETPLVAAIDDASVDVFVVEASSFRLGHSARFVPRVATWLNFAPDHLDAHRDLAAYEAAKASIWADPHVRLAVANADDPVVLRNRNPAVETRTFGLGGDADYGLRDDRLVLPDGATLLAAGDLWRRHPHDIANGLAAAATALGGGASLDGVRSALRTFRPGAHRLEPVAEAGGITWIDDSKSTSPHSTLAAIRSFDSVVLIAGGRNKGLDLSPLAAGSGHLRAVVAIGDAAGEVHSALAGHVPVRRADSMEEAVHHAAAAARQGDVVLLSPGCASFDWYGSYHERGLDYVATVRRHLGTGT